MTRELLSTVAGAREIFYICGMLRCILRGTLLHTLRRRAQQVSSPSIALYSGEGNACSGAAHMLRWNLHAEFIEAEVVSITKFVLQVFACSSSGANATNSGM